MPTSLRLPPAVTRRSFLQQAGLAAVAAAAGRAAAPAPLSLRYAVASSLYGGLSLDEILPEVPRQGSAAIDLWPRRHGTQREEADAWGRERLTATLRRHGVALALTTRFDLGPFGLAPEIDFVASHGGRLIVTGAKGPTGLTGPALRDAVRQFVEAMRPTLERARAAGVEIAIENHGSSLINLPESIRWLRDFGRGLPLGIALAPYHLPQDPALLAGLIRDLGERLLLFYAWEYGRGCMKPMPLDEELMQLPGRGPLDWAPPLRALHDIRFAGWTEIFMHPTPRGRPILETAPLVTAELNRARGHLESILRGFAR
jgi:sugar phosphate isomerase/epimerase